MLLRNVLSAVASGALLVASCDRPPPAAPEKPAAATYQGHGVLQEVAADGRKAVIQHEAIPGYMEAMTMEFAVEDDGRMQKLVRGDEVDFRLKVTEARGWIDEVIKTGHTALAEVEKKSARIGEVGAPLPDAGLLDQGGRAFHLGEFKGRALAITFIYTRCPFPDFCPRMSDQFATTQRLLKGDGWHLLSISIDPEHDTPSVLAEYARRFSADPARWTFATGDPAEIQKLADGFGLVVKRDGAEWNHNLRTVVIDPAGRVRKIFPGNEWKPEELAAELEQAMSAAVSATFSAGQK